MRLRQSFKYALHAKPPAVKSLPDVFVIAWLLACVCSTFAMETGTCTAHENKANW